MTNENGGTGASPKNIIKTGGCSSGCAGGSCGSREGTTQKIDVVTEEIKTDVPFTNRRLNLGATPSAGTFVTTIDFDLTVACNLRCTYCFKEKWNEHMEDQVALQLMLM
jgi:sulfatase maturation enzyme AslB (radical SAM superfamily)